MEVRVGNVETTSGGRQVFGAVAKADTDITTLIRQSLRAVGRTDVTEVTAFTDGCRRIWNGKAKNAKRSIDRVRKVMRVYKDERGQDTRSAPSRRKLVADREVDEQRCSTDHRVWCEAAGDGPGDLCLVSTHLRH
jgi:hypothetical protein